MAVTRITVQNNGSLRVEGDFEIVDSEGRPFGLEGILLSGVEAPKEAVRLLAEISEAVAARARLALERLGPLPQDQYTRHVSLRTALNKPWRNGMVTGVELLLESEENNFRDKTLDPTFGGAGFPPRFPSSLTFGLLMPLGRGRGSVSVAAQERASVFTVRAREEQSRQLGSCQVERVPPVLEVPVDEHVLLHAGEVEAAGVRLR